MTYGDRDLGQHWLRSAITWTNVDWSSAKSSDIHIRAILQEIPQQSITKICLNITYLIFHSNFPGANELNQTHQDEFLFKLTWHPDIVAWGSAVMVGVCFMLNLPQCTHSRSAARTPALPQACSIFLCNYVIKEDRFRAFLVPKTFDENVG